MAYSFDKLNTSNPKSTTNKMVWRSPSNIAIVKYWGKYGRQLPRNPSLSLTLNNAYSETQFEYALKATPSKGIDLSFEFEGKANEGFKNRIVKFLESINDFFPFLENYTLYIASTNSFPHSAGIASSASAMSALALCLCTMEEELSNTTQSKVVFLQKASYIARLGSGSASRSVYPSAAIWGASETIEGSSNECAIGVEDRIHPVFKSFHDDILLVNKEEKSVSSSAGHNLMVGNPFADIRYKQAFDNMDELLRIMKEGDVHAFGQLAEAEALSLHALMMTSSPSYILMHPNTLAVIDKVRQFRSETNLPLYFTLDAGPNVHLLYPDEDAAIISAFIESELVQYCIDHHYIKDIVGSGPNKMS